MQWFVGNWRDRPANPNELEVTYHIEHGSPSIFLHDRASTANIEHGRPSNFYSLDIATRSPIELSARLADTNESSE